MKKIIIINGPNLNLIGIREREIYGEQTFENYFDELKKYFSSISLEYFQSNIEGKIIDELQDNPKIWPYLTKVHEELWLPLQKELVTKSSRGKQIIAQKSGHTIVWSEPELIIQAVKELMDEYKLLQRR